MEYRKLGSSGINVSIIGIGIEHLKKKSYQETSEIIHEAVSLGVNYFDLIWSYPNIVKAIGEGISGSRSRINIAVHLGSCYKGDKYVRSRSVKRCRETFYEVLRNLDIDYVDVVNLHYVNKKDWDKIFKPDGVFDLARKLVKEGKARSIGLSTHDINLVKRAASINEINSIMYQVSMANHNLRSRDESFQQCLKNGKCIVAMKVFAKGKLLKRNRKEKFAGYITGGNGFTTRIPRSMTSAKCLHYSLNQPGVASVIPGVSSIDELKDCVSYIKTPDSEKKYDLELDELFLNAM
jgi:predicted aldo/keto reductase-like oxidoreductase